MDLTIYPGKIRGNLRAIPSKSQAHRVLICAAFSDKPTTIICPETNVDIEATVNCLREIGAVIERNSNAYHVIPIAEKPTQATLNCFESGSTLRFMLPIVGALGIDTTFCMQGRLSKRPLSPLWEEMERMGCQLSRPSENTLRCHGQLRSGNYSVPGNISSQFITGLLFAMALLDGNSSLKITGNVESKPYIEMTKQALSLFGVSTDTQDLPGSYPFRSPGEVKVEGDWSNCAFFLAANALGSSLNITGLEQDSTQGDRIALHLMEKLQKHQTISAADIPDLIPILSIVAAANEGATFTHIQRLRLKESDRVASVCAMLTSLGIRSDSDDDTLTVYPGTITGGIVDSANDHRIAMSAAIAATVSSSPVKIIQAQCVSKSYPSFWEEYRRLGGLYE